MAARALGHMLLPFMALGLCKLFLLVCFLIGLKEQEISRIEGEESRSCVAGPCFRGGQLGPEEESSM